MDGPTPDHTLLDGAGPSSRYEDRVLQPLLHCAQERRWVETNLGSARPELGKLPFKRLTQKCIFGCIRPRDWLAAIDLKDVYFLVSILPHHRPFLRFAFEGRHISTRSCPSSCPCHPVSSRKLWRQPLFP